MNYLRILSKPDARKLVLASFVRPRSALELSYLTGVPIARCYRLLWRLRRGGLIEIHGAHIRPTGRAKLLFRGKLRGLMLFMRDNRLLARIERPRISEPSEGR